MKRKVAKRKLQRKCNLCNCGFKKGEVYYVNRNVWADDGKVFASEYTMCPKCKYKSERSNERYKRFGETCEHPQGFVFTQYSYMSGESILEPSHDECLLCGRHVR